MDVRRQLCACQNQLIIQIEQASRIGRRPPARSVRGPLARLSADSRPNAMYTTFQWLKYSIYL